MTFWNTMMGWVPPWLAALALFVTISAVGIGLHALLLRWLASRPPDWHPFVCHAAKRTRRLIRYMILLFAAGMAVPLLHLPHDVRDDVRKVFLALFIIQLGWVVLAAANIAMDRYVYGFKLDTTDNLMARKAVTQMRIVRQAVNVLLGLLTLAFALMSFDSVRQFGISLFASAGMAGIVAGLAARPLLENLIAGLQLAVTQPLRLGDAVMINNEFGTVEEITSVYIVVRLWDLRRQVVPLSYLFTTPFVNWTRSSSSIIGAVMLYLDYTLPVDRLRAKAEEIVKASPLWDGQVVNVQVSDAREQVMELRILVSAADSGRAWDLRCEVREKLIAYVRDAFPEALPRIRRQDFKVEADAPRLPGAPEAAPPN